MQVGQRVLKFSGDYQLEGVIVSVFQTTAGKTRYVVEHDPGFLHIYSDSNIRLVDGAKSGEAVQLDFEHGGLDGYATDGRVPDTSFAWNNPNGLSDDELGSSALTEPAPAGEAVEPVEAVVKRIDDMFDAFLDRYATYEGNVSTDDLADYLFDVREAVRSLAYLAPEDTARLRQDLERDFYRNSLAEEIIDALEFYDRVVASSDEERIAVGTDHWTRLLAAVRDFAAHPTPEDTARLREDLGQSESDKATFYTKLQDAERERDDARKALESIQSWVCEERVKLATADPDFTPKYVTLKSVGKKIREEIAARSASMEATR